LNESQTTVLEFLSAAANTGLISPDFHFLPNHGSRGVDKKANAKNPVKSRPATTVLEIIIRPERWSQLDCCNYEQRIDQR